jgi:hypothetical protein
LRASVALISALVQRDWQQATELIERMKGGDDLNFSYIMGPVPLTVTLFFCLGFKDTNLAKTDRRDDGDDLN